MVQIKYFVFAILYVANACNHAVGADANEAALIKELGKNTLALFPVSEQRCYAANFTESTGLEFIFVSRSFATSPIFERLGPDPEEAKKNAVRWGVGGSFSAGKIKVFAGFHDTPQKYGQSLNCSDGKNGQVECRVDREGGGFNLIQRESKIFFNFDKSSGQRFLLKNGNDDSFDQDYPTREMTLKMAEDDFELKSTEPELCEEFEGYVRPKFASYPIPLQRSLAKQNIKCLNYAFDPKLLVSRDKESLSRVDIFIKSPPEMSVNSDGFYKTTFAASLSFMRFDGAKASNDVVCEANDFEFVCGKEFRLRRNDNRSAHLVIGASTGQTDEDRKLAGLHIAKSDEQLTLKFGTGAECGSSQ